MEEWSYISKVKKTSTPKCPLINERTGATILKDKQRSKRRKMCTGVLDECHMTFPIANAVHRAKMLTEGRSVFGSD